ncbi:hypothetical protein AB1M95_00875 [Sulfitobacter sp. LCG007]
MTRIAELGRLQQAVEARYNLRQADFRKLVEEENRLRSELRRLDAQVSEAERQGDPQMRAIGADLLWKGWVGRTKQDLNTRLARVLSRKEARIAEVRTEYGRVLAVGGLLAEARAAQRNEADRRRLDLAIELALMSSLTDQ